MLYYHTIPLTIIIVVLCIIINIITVVQVVVVNDILKWHVSLQTEWTEDVSKCFYVLMFGNIQTEVHRPAIHFKIKKNGLGV